jgi:F-type H+-transporting ATPase subunit b
MKQRFLTVGFLVLAAMPLYAQEHGGADLSPFAGNVGNALWTLIIFAIVVIVLGKFAWGPVLGLLQQREEFIHKSLAAAKADREAAAATLKEHTEKLQAATREVDAMIARGRDDAERFREEIKQKARAEADTLLRAAERQIQQETSQALQQIRHEAVDLSVAIASKLIKRNITKEDNQRLIDDALQQLEKPGTASH